MKKQILVQMCTDGADKVTDLVKSSGKYICTFFKI